MEAITHEAATYKLISASGEKLARRLGEAVGLIDIIGNDARARISEERGGRVLVIETRGEVVEIETFKY